MGLPWIKLDKEFPSHRKAVVLAALLSEDRAWTYAVELWLWVARHAPTGDLGGLPDAAVARAAGWRGDGVAFVAALRQAGFLDEQNQIVGWVKHNGAHMKKQAADKARNQRLTTVTTPTQLPLASESLVSHERVTSVESREYRIKNTTLKNNPIFENPKIGTLEAEPAKPKRGRPKKAISEPEAKAKGEGNPEWQAEQADGEAWVAKARQVIGLTPEESPWDKSTWMSYRRVRRQYGAPTLLRALEALISDPWASKQGLRTLLSGAVIQRGLAMAAKTGPTMEATWSKLDDATVQAQLRSTTGET